MNSQVINVQHSGGWNSMLTKSQITMNIYRNPNLLILVLCAYGKKKALLGIVTLSGSSDWGQRRRAQGIVHPVKIKPWYSPFLSHLGFSPGPHIVTALACLSQAVCRIVWELNWIEKAQDDRGSKDQFFIYLFIYFYFLVPAEWPAFSEVLSHVSESLRIHFYKGSPL